MREAICSPASSDDLEEWNLTSPRERVSHVDDDGSHGEVMQGFRVLFVAVINQPSPPPPLPPPASSLSSSSRPSIHRLHRGPSSSCFRGWSMCGSQRTGTGMMCPHGHPAFPHEHGTIRCTHISHTHTHTCAHTYNRTQMQIQSERSLVSTKRSGLN